MNKKDAPAKMLALQLKDLNPLYNYYMLFLGRGDLSVLADSVFSLGEDILLAVEIADYPKHLLPTKVAWISPMRTSAYRLRGAGLTFSEHESRRQIKNPIEAELGPYLCSDRITFIL